MSQAVFLNKLKRNFEQRELEKDKSAKTLEKSQNNVDVERVDQGQLQPRLEVPRNMFPPGIEHGPPQLKASIFAKSYSNSLFGTSTYELGTWPPPPSAYAVCTFSPLCVYYVFFWGGGGGA
jgi:hypothetical protein